MIPSRQSGTPRSNTRLEKRPRPKGQTNRQWLSKALGESDGAGRVLLLGGTSLTDFRLRVAQSHARQDLLPSFWSHAAIVKGKSKGKDWDLDLYEVSLDPPAGFGFVPRNNGVQEAGFSRYDDPQRFPNIACIQFTVKPQALDEGTSFAQSLDKAVGTFRRQRSLVDLGAFIVDWLAFVWGAGEKGNPLLKGVGVPSAVFVEGAFAIADLELTPGLSSQSSCPEAIWQSAKWWHRFYESEAAITEEAPAGKYFIGQNAAAASDD